MSIRAKHKNWKWRRGATDDRMYEYRDICVYVNDRLVGVAHENSVLRLVFSDHGRFDSIDAAVQAILDGVPVSD